MLVTFAGGRRAGKTTAIIKWLSEDSSRIVLARNQQEARAYFAAGIERSQVVTSVPALRGRSSDVALEEDDPLAKGGVEVYSGSLERLLAGA